MTGREPRHGFDDDAETRRLLRSPPSPQALRWVESTTGTSVTGWAVLRGGTSSAMYTVELEVPAGRTLVLRCYVRPEMNRDEPDLAAREAVALRAAEAAAVATPHLVAVDPTGDLAGVPALLMTRLGGQVVWDPRAPLRWLARMAELVPEIHAVDASTTDVGRYANYRQDEYAVPRWAADPATWERAIEIFHGPVLEDAICFIHRDFHPGNILWSRGHVTGVVDWQAACIGPPSIDIAHCRANLLRYAPDLADPFTGLAEDATGRPFHPWADIASLIGMLDNLRRSPPRPAGRRAIEAALGRAVEDCR